MGWTEEQVETAIRLLVVAEKLIAPLRDQEGEWERAWEQINRFLNEEA